MMRLVIISLVSVIIPLHASAGLLLGPEILVRADDAEISVPGYSVPSFVFWDGDTLRDLIVGEGSGTAGDGRVRVYLNSGTSKDPLFTGFFYVQSAGYDLTSPGGG